MPTTPHPRNRPKILVIEDETITAHHLSRTLTRLGYEVVGIATTGAEAMEKAAQNQPDLLLADVGLDGDVDGVSVAAMAQEQWKIPAVFLTALTDSETMRRARLAEPYGYLVKPFAEQELHATIEIALQQRGLAAEREQQTVASAQLLERTRDELANATAQLFTVQEQERERIARDLHDDFAQRLAILQIQIETIAQEMSAADGAEMSRFRPVCRDLEKLGNDLRQLSHRLHPSLLDDLGLTKALRQLAEDFTERYNLPVRVSARNTPDEISGPVRLALYRIAQEALLNVAKHAGAATVNIALTGNARGLDLSIRDTGNGFYPKSKRHRTGLGLVSMAQRAELIEGTFELRSQPEEGTQVHVHVPAGKY